VVSKASAFKNPDTEPTVRLTVAQATIRFLANQYAERDGERGKFFAGCFGIFGHGNVAGIGQALLEAEVEAAQAGTEPAIRYVLGRNEQAMVHTAAAYARQKDRLQAWAVTASIGPGSTNMLTGAALATINRLPVLLLPSDTFATRVSAPVLQQLEAPNDGGQRRVQAAVPILRPGVAPRAVTFRTAGCDACAHRPGRDRGGHDCDAPGCAGRSIRLAGIAVRRTDLARRKAGA
jgi:3D-(3,5/4)-trihydroxycyclohexane-1,2-dione acylhydrolase (decyclizing)